MFYKKYRKIIVALFIITFIFSSVPNNNISTFLSVSNTPNNTVLCSSLRTESATSPAIDTNTSSGSAIDAQTTTNSSIETPLTSSKLSILVPKKVSLYPNEKKKLRITVKNSSSKVKIRYESKKTSIVKINTAGKMTAKKPGKTTIITIIKINGKKYTRKTKVTVINAYLTFTKATVLLGRGQTFQFKVKKYNIKKTVTWSVNNSRIASIGKKNGKLYGKSNGSVLVTATCGSLQSSIYVTIR